VIKNGMQSVAIHYAQPVTFLQHFACLYFSFFSNISKTVVGPSHLWFYREFQALSFDKKVF
jgi:hypothetical protein